MKTHIEVLGWLYIVFGAMGLLGGLGLFVFFSGLALLPDEPSGAFALVLIGWVIGGLLVITSVPDIIGGIGLLKRKNWARILVIILGCIQLIGFPIGTALGIYTLWVLLKEETTKHFVSA